MSSVGFSGKALTTGPGGLVAQCAVGNPSNSQENEKDDVIGRFAYATPPMPVVAGTRGSFGDGDVQGYGAAVVAKGALAPGSRGHRR